jgi:putative RNA 2'-phosphotransferase
MERERRTRVSKFLSKHLRHDPAALGIALEPGGWIAVDVLLAACAARGVELTRAELDEVVRTSDKQRFAFDATGTRLRASQGHSVPIELSLEPVEPPQVLYHGTHAGALAAIEREGLSRMQRHHVHLSSDVETATRVGARRGPAIVLRVDAQAMRRDGFVFFRSDNGVWLVERVPPAYLARA